MTAWLSPLLAAAALGWWGWLTRPNVARRRAVETLGVLPVSERPTRSLFLSGWASREQAPGRRAPGRKGLLGGSKGQPIRTTGNRATYKTAAELSSLIDIVMVGVSSGLSILAALQLAAADGPQRLGKRLNVLLDQDERPLADVLDEFGRYCGPRAAPFVEVLASSIRYGIPLVPSLERIQRDLREETRRRIDKRVRQLPVLMLFPLVFCVLPALGLVGVVPVLIAAFQL